jgi:hypothetical protein
MQVNQNLLISADLACPPSELGAFRSLTFFAHRFPPYFHVLSIVPDWGHRDTYWSWFKTHNLFDHVEDLVGPDEVVNNSIVLFRDRITCDNLEACLRSLGIIPLRYTPRAKTE